MRDHDAASRPLRIVLDARVWDQASGGVQQWVLGLAAAFSALDDADDEYLFLVDPGREGWLQPYVSGPCRIVMSATRPHRDSAVSAIRAHLADRMPAVRSAWRRIKAVPLAHDAIAVSDGTVERLNPDLVHFTFQEAFRTTIPSFYQPWDLQHRHLPEFFPARERDRRDASYRAFCEQAALVVVASDWVKRDLTAQYGIPDERIAVVNVPPVTSAYPHPTSRERTSMRERLQLPGRFLLYPAQAWPHKNHARLLRALALLRARGLRIPLVCTGASNEHSAAVRRAAGEAGVADDVVFLGFVAPEDLAGLYYVASALVFPSLFEGWGMPVLEAFRAGLPVTCSNATSLPELVGDAALVFDPLDVEAIAYAVNRIWVDEDLRIRLRERGRERAQAFSWERTVRTLRAYYRRAARRPLDDYDRLLISARASV